jgi:dienelactone hydrolase
MSPPRQSGAAPGTRARRTRARRAALAGLVLSLLATPLAGCAATAMFGLSIPTSAPGQLSEQIPATLTRPEGPGPFPAVVIMHDCSGLGPQSSGAPGRWAAELGRRGHVVLIPDSFTTRGHPAGVCVQSATGFALGPAPSRNDVSPARRVHDVYAALAYLRTLAYVDGRRVGLMGGSHGGSTTLATMAARAEKGFAAAVALYPSCAPGRRGWQADLSGVYRTAAPVLILIGERDDWTPAAPCVKLAEEARQAAQPVAIKVYPGAHHSFDSDRPVHFRADRVNANAPGGRGATTGGDPRAWEDSIREVVAFFARHLQ